MPNPARLAAGRPPRRSAVRAVPPGSAQRQAGLLHQQALVLRIVRVAGNALARGEPVLLALRDHQLAHRLHLLARHRLGLLGCRELVHQHGECLLVHRDVARGAAAAGELPIGVMDGVAMLLRCTVSPLSSRRTISKSRNGSRRSNLARCSSQSLLPGTRLGTAQWRDHRRRHLGTAALDAVALGADEAQLRPAHTTSRTTMPSGNEVASRSRPAAAGPGNAARTDRSAAQQPDPRAAPHRGVMRAFRDLLDRQMTLDATANLTCLRKGDFALKEIFFEPLTRSCTEARSRAWQVAPQRVCAPGPVQARCLPTPERSGLVGQICATPAAGYVSRRCVATVRRVRASATNTAHPLDRHARREAPDQGQVRLQEAGRRSTLVR